MKKKTKKIKEVYDRLIDNVTVTNLDIALRMCEIQLDEELINKIIDLVELLEVKSDEVSIFDICVLQAKWDRQHQIIKLK